MFQMLKRWRSKKRDTLPIEREVPPGQVAQFADDVVVLTADPEVHLFFFQTEHPVVISNDPAERARKWGKIQSVTRQCVCKIVMSAERLPSVIRAMQEQVDRRDDLQYPVKGGDA